MSSHDENSLPAGSPPEPSDPRTWSGVPVWGEADMPLGHVARIYFHNLTHRATWIQVSDGVGAALVPLDHAIADGRGVRVPYRFEQLVTAPRPDSSSPQLDASIEQALYQHYRVTVPAMPAAAAVAVPQGVVGDGPGRGPGSAGDGVVIRSEERLRTGRQLHPYRRVRLVTYIVTEDVSFTVPVSRQEVRLEEVPLTATAEDTGAAAAELTADIHEVVLHREEVGFTTRVVATERVRLVRRIVAGEQVVYAERRAEQVDLIHGPLDPTGAPSPAGPDLDPLETRHEPT